MSKKLIRIVNPYGGLRALSLQGKSEENYRLRHRYISHLVYKAIAEPTQRYDLGAEPSPTEEQASHKWWHDTRALCDQVAAMLLRSGKAGDFELVDAIRRRGRPPNGPRAKREEDARLIEAVEALCREGSTQLEACNRLRPDWLRPDGKLYQSPVSMRQAYKLAKKLCLKR